MSVLYYWNPENSEWTSVSIGKAGPEGPAGQQGPPGVIATGDIAPESPQINDLWVDTSGESATILDLDAIVEKIVNKGIVQSIASQSSVSFETFTQPGRLFPGTGRRRFTFPIRGNLQGWIATVNEAPIGSPLIVRLLLNGLMIDEGQIEHGSTIMFERQLPIQSVNPGDHISVNIQSVGDIEPGYDLVVTARWQPKIDNQWFSYDGEKIDVLDVEGIVDALAAHYLVASEDISRIVKISESDFYELEEPDPQTWYIVKEDPQT